jgi:hypothetical protein
VRTNRTKETVEHPAWRLESAEAAYIVPVGEEDRSGHRDLRYRIETRRPRFVRDLVEGYSSLKLAWPMTEERVTYRLAGRRGFLGIIQRSGATISIELHGEHCCIELRARRVHYLSGGGDGGFIGYLADEDLTHSGARHWWELLSRRLGISTENGTRTL